jgi:hypothetical protein
MRIFLFFLLTFALAGCDNFGDYFSPATTQAILIGVDELPEGIELGAPAEATVFVARARSLNSFSANLIDDAESVVLTSEGGSFTLGNEGVGVYELSSLEDGNFEYIAGDTWTLTIDEGGKIRRTSVIAPSSPDLGDPTEVLEHDAGATLEFDLSGQGFDHYVAAVGQIQADGDFILTYDSRPTTAQDYIDWIKPGGNDPGLITIPGSAFPDGTSSYVVGVAGMRKADPASFTRLNPAISNLVAGTMSGRVVVTGL